MTRLYRGATAALTATIANGDTTSAAVTTGGLDLIGLALPAAFTGIALTFQVSADGVTYQPLRDNTDAAISLTVAAGHSYTLPAALSAWPFVKIVSGSAEGAARTLTLVGKG